jgi:putative ABC transport system ATP-binding protein
VRRGIGFIFQQHNLFEALTAFQNVNIVTELNPSSPRNNARRARQILEDVGLGDHLHKKPHKLSGGQRQRGAIARALVNRPKLVIADEPTAALDKETGRMVVNLLKNLARDEGAAVIIVTHDNRILDVADRIVRMVDGYIESDIDIGESMTVVSFLKKCPVFEKSSPAMLADTAAKMRHEHFAAGDIIIRQGDIGDKFYILRTGQVEVLHTPPDGSASVVGRLGPGDFFGELALLKEVPRSATIKASGDVDVLTLSKEVFLSIVEMSESFQEQVKRVYF